jgi:hypothetical protein
MNWAAKNGKGGSRLRSNSNYDSLMDVPSFHIFFTYLLYHSKS